MSRAEIVLCGHVVVHYHKPSGHSLVALHPQGVFRQGRDLQDKVLRYHAKPIPHEQIHEQRCSPVSLPLVGLVAVEVRVQVPFHNVLFHVANGLVQSLCVCMCVCECGGGG